MKTKNKHKIDKIDRIILNLLQDKARTPYLEIAKKCKLSGAAIHQRIKSLERKKVIKGYFTKIDSSFLNMDIIAFIGIKFENKKNFKNIIKDLKKIPEIIEAYYTTDEYDLIIKVICKSIEDLRKLIIENLNFNIDSVQTTNTFLSLGEVVNRSFPIKIND